MSALLASPMHIILCLRAREKAKPESRSSTAAKNGLRRPRAAADHRENVVFEATASLMMHDQGLRHDAIKVPKALQGVLGGGQGYLGVDEGLAIRAWRTARSSSTSRSSTRGLLQLAAENGLAALQDAWGKTPARVRKVIGPEGLPDDSQASAAAFDASRQAPQADDSGTPRCAQRGGG